MCFLCAEAQHLNIIWMTFGLKAVLRLIPGSVFVSRHVSLCRDVCDQISTCYLVGTGWQSGCSPESFVSSPSRFVSHALAYAGLFGKLHLIGEEINCQEMY
jgi:hypothetical protein